MTRLLLDHNLSPKMVKRLDSLFPGITHTRATGLSVADDSTVWAYAIAHDLAIVSKDDDLRQRALISGPPPKLVWLKVGNSSTTEIERVLIGSEPRITAFLAEPESSLLILDPFPRLT